MKSNNTFIYVLVGLGVLLGIGFGGKILIDKVADRVVQKLQREYGPSPYGPGIDPDKIDMDRIRQQDWKK